MEKENNKALATAAIIRDVIYLLFAIYAFYIEIIDFSIMANLAIVIPHCASAIYEIRNEENGNTRRLAELSCFIISLIDITLVMLLGNGMQNVVKSGIISSTGIIIICSIIGISRSFLGLVDDYQKADFGISLPIRKRMLKSKEEKEEQR